MKICQYYIVIMIYLSDIVDLIGLVIGENFIYNISIEVREERCRYEW